MKSTHIDGIYELDSGKEGKTITVIGGIHGDETTGIEIVEDLLINTPHIDTGKVYVGYGNPSAINQGVRFIDYDLNRCFGSNPGKGLEAQRASELKEILDDTDILIDLHSTIKPSDPFICAPVLHPCITYFPFDTIIYGNGLYPGWKEGKVLDPVYADTYVVQNQKQGSVGFTVETGQHGDTEALTWVLEGIYSLIDNTLNGLEASPFVGDKDYFEAYHNIVAQRGFQWNGAFENFEFVPEQTIIAVDAYTYYPVLEDSYIVFPKEHPIEGLEACILVRSPPVP